MVWWPGALVWAPQGAASIRAVVTDGDSFTMKPRSLCPQGTTRKPPGVPHTPQAPGAPATQEKKSYWPVWDGRGGGASKYRASASPGASGIPPKFRALPPPR